MNSIDRILTTLKYREPDRIPVLPVLLLQGAKVLHLKLSEYLQNHEHMVNGQAALVDKYGHDGVFGIPHVVEDIEPFGGQISYCEYGPPTVSKMAWRQWADVETVQVPDPTRHPALVRTLKTIEGLAQKFKGQKLIVGGAIAPFSLPSMLIGSEKWLELLWEDELIRAPIFKRVMQICQGFCVAWCNAQLQAGADIVVLADGMASATCIMREQFEKYALPVVKQTINAIQGTVAYEPVGRIQPFIDLLPDIGASVMLLECDDDIKQCKACLHGKIAVMGNLNNIEMIQWSREKTLQECRKTIAQAAAGGGFILSAQGPDVPWDTPEEVIQAIVESVNQ
jgi:uroporphyrinogen decarboxylase